VVPALSPAYRCIRPTLPLGAHRRPMRPDADLSLTGMVGIVADFLDHLDLTGVTLVHNDWGGGLFLTAIGRDQRVARHVVSPCEAFDNFPPGLPGRLARLASWIPGGLALALRQLRSAGCDVLRCCSAGWRSGRCRTRSSADRRLCSVRAAAGQVVTLSQPPSM
jgi:pimeloyl-ACP methyl ester carboxylesterase